MPPDPVHQLNRSARQADFTYRMVVDVVKIQDTGKDKAFVADEPVFFPMTSLRRHCQSRSAQEQQARFWNSLVQQPQESTEQAKRSWSRRLLGMYRSYFCLATAIRSSLWAISSGGRTKSTHPLSMAVFGMKA
jgi:hypothetical protein